MIAGAATSINRGKTPNTASPEPPEVQVAAVEQRDLPIVKHSISGTVAEGILDRLVHKAHRVEMKGESMRKEKAVKTER